MFLRYLKFTIVLINLIIPTTALFAQDNSAATAKQVVEKFQAD